MIREEVRLRHNAYIKRLIDSNVLDGLPIRELPIHQSTIWSSPLLVKVSDGKYIITYYDISDAVYYVLGVDYNGCGNINPHDYDQVLSDDNYEHKIDDSEDCIYYFYWSDDISDVVYFSNVLAAKSCYNIHFGND